MKKLIIILLVAVLAVVFVACGGSETTTTKSDTTTTAAGTTTQTTTGTPDGTTTVQQTTTVVTTTVAITTTTPGTTAPLSEVEEAVGYRTWVELHSDITLGSKKDAQGVEHEWVFFFGIKAEGNHFYTDEETGAHGISYTEGSFFYIKDINSTEDYKRYECGYYETKDWWQIWAEPVGFTPVDGVTYDIYFMFEGDETHCDTPDEGYYIWPLQEFTYTAPAPVVSENGDINQMIPDIKDRTQLIYHDELSVDTTTNKVKFTFKSDGDPFSNGGDLPGVSFTLFGNLYINGEKVEIVTDSYETEAHYIIYFTVADYTFTEGTEYEFVFTIESNDSSGTYCSNAVGYFVLDTCTAITPVAATN